MNITNEFGILELVLVPNFSLNWQFWFFGPNLPKKGQKPKNREHSWFIGQQGKGEAFFNSPLLLAMLYRIQGISRPISTDSSPLCIASSWTRIGNLWFPSASLEPLSYASVKLRFLGYMGTLLLKFWNYSKLSICYHMPEAKKLRTPLSLPHPLSSMCVQSLMYVLVQ